MKIKQSEEEIRQLIQQCYLNLSMCFLKVIDEKEAELKKQKDDKKENQNDEEEDDNKPTDTEILINCWHQLE